MTNKEINEDILKLCYIPINEDFSNIEESKGTYLPVFLKYFDHTDTCIRDGQYRLQGWLDLEYLTDSMMYLPEGDYEYSPKELKHLMVWSIRLDIIEQKTLKLKKYYFVYYECERTEWNDGFTMGSYIVKEQCIIDIHPIQFQLDCNEKYGFIQDNDGGIPIGNIGYTHRENYKVINWIELTEEEYKKFEGTVG